jgi:hypothetical protein
MLESQYHPARLTRKPFAKTSPGKVRRNDRRDAIARKRAWLES